MYKNKKILRIESPTYMPSIILKAKGKFDAEKGVGISDSAIFKLYHKEAMIEASECLRCERHLFDTRQNAAKLLKALERDEMKLKMIPEDMSGCSPEVIRFNRRNSENKSSASASIADAINTISALNQKIVTTETILYERINKIRAKTNAKIHAYVEGARRALPDYNAPEKEFNDNATVLYQQRHYVLDQAIKARAEKASHGGDIHEIME